ncbi:tail fiber domain-containing protein [Alphaproteobacteria bacterium]|nr:tail fiber domain-containing protein [Alphaproteobacteria bacterium]
MGYVGNQQTEGFSQVPAKQDLTGATGTSLTLTHAVASAEGIDLFINNVRQEPTTAYSVGADGVTVTLTGSVVATDDIYVVYNSLARQTSTHPSNQHLNALSGTFSGAVSAASATVTGDLTVDTNTLYVDSTNNRVGIGTASPATALDLGTTLGAKLTLYPTNYSIGVESNELRIASNAVTSFYSGGHSGTERVRLTADGSLLVNTTSGAGAAKLVVSADTNVANPMSVVNTKTSAGGEYAILFYRAGSLVGSIQTSLSATSYLTSSDYRLKENVTDITDATTRLKQLNPVRFNFITDADTTVDGFLAHEVQSVVPEAISGTHNEVDDDGNPVYQGIDQSKLVPLLVKTIQELEARITALEAN